MSAPKHGSDIVKRTNEIQEEAFACLMSGGIAGEHEDDSDEEENPDA